MGARALKSKSGSGAARGEGEMVRVKLLPRLAEFLSKVTANRWILLLKY